MSYAKVNGMYLVPMKRKPGRPRKLSPKAEQLWFRAELDVIRALDKAKGDQPRSEYLYDMLKEKLRSEGLLKT